MRRTRQARRQTTENEWFNETRNLKTRGSMIKEENDKLEKELQQILEFNKKHYFQPKPVALPDFNEKDTQKTLKRIGGGYVKEVKPGTATAKIQINVKQQKTHNKQ